MAAGIAATWPDGNIAVHFEWLAAEPHLSATLQSAGLIGTWDSYGLDYLPGEATRDVASFGGSMTGSGELVRRCKSDWALHGCEVMILRTEILHHYIYVIAPMLASTCLSAIVYLL